MARVWYVGLYPYREITPQDWDDVGLFGPHFQWSADNGWSVDQEAFRPAHLTYLAGDPEFLLDQTGVRPDTPTPQDDVTRPYKADASILKLVDDAFDALNAAQAALTTIDQSKTAAATSASQAKTFRDETNTLAEAAKTALTNLSNASEADLQALSDAAELALTNLFNTSKLALQTLSDNAEADFNALSTAAKDHIAADHQHIHLDVTHADTHATAAGTFSGIATTKATEAAGSASVATTKASEASQARADSLTYRNTAQGAATTATTQAGISTAKAAEATLGATTATTKAGEAAVSAATLAGRITGGGREIAYTSDGKPYFLPPASYTEVDLRVDTAIGTRVMLGTTMIHGDTGWRNVVADLINGWAGGSVRMRRVGDVVHMRIPALGFTMAGATADVFYKPPAGFFPSTGANYGNLGFALVSLSAAGTDSIVPVSRDFNAGVSMRRVATGHFTSMNVTWHTSDPWPASLPGIPST